MASKLLSSVGGGGGLSNLAPATIPNEGTYEEVFAIDATGSLTEILSLSGKFNFSHLSFSDMVSDDMSKIKLTIDGVDIWDEDPYTPPTGGTFGLLGGVNAITARYGEAYEVKSSLSLSIEMATDNSIAMQYLARPIV